MQTPDSESRRERMASKTFFGAVAVLAGVCVLTVAVLRAELNENDDQHHRQFLGSFITTVHAPQSPVGPRTFKALVTLTPGGGIVITFFTPDGAQNNTHGTWVRTGHREVKITSVGISPDVVLPSGERVSFVSGKIREEFTFDESGNSYTGVFQNEFFDASGHLVRSGSGTVEGTRITVEPLN
jgi:hypothetical protein